MPEEEDLIFNWNTGSPGDWKPQVLKNMLNIEGAMYL